ncbi:MAG: transglycosylase family protein, partial [Acidimicrobiales bacterium]|nr:transglycosylase family protein [Acidimicrobiales bacterium]
PWRNPPMSGQDHPPRSTSPAHPPRRALATAVGIALALLIAVALSSASGGTSFAGAAVPESLTPQAEGTTSQAAARRTLADVEEIAKAIAPPTTTTTVAPTTTTTATPPPPPPAPAPPAPAPQPTTTGSGYNDPANPAAWDRLAQCESGGNWAINTGTGYYGGIQFSLSSWQAVGGTGYPNEHSRETQIAMGQRLWQQGGWAHWPGCSRQLGYR